MLKGDYIYNKNKTVIYRVMWSTIDGHENDNDIVYRMGTGRFHGKIVWTKKHPNSTYKVGEIRKRLMCRDYEKLSLSEKRDLILDLTLY